MNNYQNQPAHQYMHQQNPNFGGSREDEENIFKKFGRKSKWKNIEKIKIKTLLDVFFYIHLKLCPIKLIIESGTKQKLIIL